MVNFRIVKAWNRTNKRDEFSVQRKGAIFWGYDFVSGTSWGSLEEAQEEMHSFVKESMGVTVCE